MLARTILWIATAAILLCLPALPAAADGRIQLKTVAEMEKAVVNDQGRQEIRRVPATRLLHGQEVIFSTYYQNIGSEMATNAVIIHPIPENMIYKERSATGAGAQITFSVDGGQTYNAPAMLFIFDAAGRQFPVRPQDYTHISWKFDKPLPAGAQGVVSFRAILK